MDGISLRRMFNFEKNFFRGNSLIVENVGILGAGHSLAMREVGNEELCLSLNVTPEWIEKKTGIRARRIASNDETASSFALNASISALNDAGVEAGNVGLIIVATFSADYVFPAAAVRLQSDLGIQGGHAFDIQANCSGLVTALTLAAERMSCDTSIQYALVVGLELCSRYTDSTDFESAIYLSDGAGAIVIGRSDTQGFLGSAFWTESSNYESVRLRGGGSSWRESDRYETSRFMEMNGLATWRQAITILPQVIKSACQKSEIDVGDIDKFVFHQANLRLIEYLMKKMKRSMDSTFINVDQIGNTGAASIAIALSEAKSNGFFGDGDLICLAGVGAGFTFGASLWRWGSINL